jgi:uncharacterized protein (TIGR02646 family)
MRTIEKGDEPASLRRHRRADGTWETYTERDDARHALLEEQGHICCFCMRRIELRGMKVAHWDPQSGEMGQTRTLDWDNLLGACVGGDGGPRAEQHCDTAQGDTPITVHPADRRQRCERLVRYLRDGTVASDDPKIREDIDQTLRLNYGPLKKARQRVLDALFTHLEREGGKAEYWSRALLERELAEWRSRDGERRLPEFCQVAIYVLAKKLDKRKI